MTKPKSNTEVNPPESTDSKLINESNDNNDKISQAIQSEVLKAAQHGRPIPRPEDLNAYNLIVPNAAERILQMAEHNSLHRRQLERIQIETKAEISKSAIKIESRNSLLGLVFAFSICMLAIGGGIYLALIGAQLAGSFISITALSSLVTAFVVGSKSNAKEKPITSHPENTNEDD